MEIADVFVINKADRDGVERTRRDLEMLLGMTDGLDWRPEVLKTVASRGEGIEELLAEVGRHQDWLASSGELAERRRRQLRLRVENILKRKILERADEVVGLDRAIERAREEGLDPYRVANRLYLGVVGSEKGKP